MNKGGGGLFDPNKSGKASKEGALDPVNGMGACEEGLKRNPHNKRPCAHVQKAGQPLPVDSAGIDREALETLNLDDRRKGRGPISEAVPIF